MTIKQFEDDLEIIELNEEEQEDIARADLSELDQLLMIQDEEPIEPEEEEEILKQVKAMIAQNKKQKIKPEEIFEFIEEDEDITLSQVPKPVRKTTKRKPKSSSRKKEQEKENIEILDTKKVAKSETFEPEKKDINNEIAEDIETTRSKLDELTEPLKPAEPDTTDIEPPTDPKLLKETDTMRIAEDVELDEPLAVTDIPNLTVAVEPITLPKPEPEMVKDTMLFGLNKSFVLNSIISGMDTTIRQAIARSYLQKVFESHHKYEHLMGLSDTIETTIVAGIDEEVIINNIIDSMNDKLVAAIAKEYLDKIFENHKRFELMKNKT